jgi:hypothetical protein
VAFSPDCTPVAEMVVSDVDSDHLQEAGNRVAGLNSELPQYAPAIGAQREVSLLDESVDNLWRVHTAGSCGAGGGNGDDGVEAPYELVPGGGITTRAAFDQPRRRDS